MVFNVLSYVFNMGDLIMCKEIIVGDVYDCVFSESGDTPVEKVQVHEVRDRSFKGSRFNKLEYIVITQRGVAMAAFDYDRNVLVGRDGLPWIYHESIQHLFDIKLSSELASISDRLKFLNERERREIDFHKALQMKKKSV